MSPYKPDHWPGLFELYLTDGDLDSVVALYEPDACFLPESGEPLAGRERIRPMLAELIARKTELHGEVVKVMTVGDVAVLYTDWQGQGLDGSAKVIEYRSRAIEVLRRQPDGKWKLIVGDPNARG